MTQPLSGRVGFVTGAGSGIGRATAERFADAGAAVVVSDVDEARGRETVERIEAAGRTAAFVRCDVAQADDVAAAVAFALATYGRLDVACNNAGIPGAQLGVLEYSEAGWRKMLDVNLTSVFLCIRNELPPMLAQGAGAIVNIASEASIKGNAANVAYTAAKHGVIGLTKSVALEFAAQGIRVNAVCPGVIRTGIIAKAQAEIPDVLERYAGIQPNQRMGEAIEIAEAVLWLCTDASSLVNGHALVADGGWAIA